MDNALSKKLTKAIERDIKSNETLIAALKEDSEQYSSDNSTTIKRLKETNSKLENLLRDGL